MMKDVCEVRIAYLQNQALRAVRGARRDRGSFALRCRSGAPRRGCSTPISEGGVIKQRIARKGGGRSGGFRTIVVFRRGEFAFFAHGFAKSDQDNLRRKALLGLRSLANEYLALNAAGLAAARAVGAIIEVECDEQAV